jgi:formimidoylglutamate deiminase
MMVAQDQVLHVRSALLPGGWSENVRITLSGGIIAAVVTGAAQEPGDEAHAALLPGMPNLHSHAFQRAMAGLTEIRGSSADSFWTWRETMYRFVDRIGPEELAAISALAYLEMLETGFTRVGEFHYLHHDIAGRAFADPAEMTHAIVAAALETGIGLTHLPVFYAHSGFGGAAPGHGQRRFVHDIDGFGRLLEAARAATAALPDAIVGIAPHSLRAVTPDELAVLIPLAGEAPIHIHIAEQTREVDDCVAWSGARPVEWLLDHASVDSRWCLVHATHMTDPEVRALAASGAVAGLCPITEANLGDGLFPAGAFLAANGRFGIGSDSNVLIDVSEELRLLEYGQRLLSRGRNILSGTEQTSTGEYLFRSAVAGGACALGVGGAGIAVGRSADFVSLNVEHPSLYGRREGRLLDSWLFSGGSRSVDCVWRRGKKLVSHGRHHDRERIADRYRNVLKKMIA